MTTKEKIINEYRKLRQSDSRFLIVGENAKQAMKEAKINVAFETAEDAGLVRLRFIPDDYYDDSYLECHGWSEEKVEKEKKKLWDLISREGVWILIDEYRTLPLHHKEDFPPWHSLDEEPGWVLSSSIGGLIGQEPNGYEADIKEETLNALRNTLKSRCPVCRSTRG